MLNMEELKELYRELYAGGGKIPADALPLWLRRAEAELSRITGGKTDGAQDEKIRFCLCEMAEAMFTAEARGGIEAENNDGYSVRYAKGDTKSSAWSVARRCLSGTDYLYRGDVL